MSQKTQEVKVLVDIAKLVSPAESLIDDKERVLSAIKNNYNDHLVYFNEMGGITAVVLCYEAETIIEPDDCPSWYCGDLFYVDNKYGVNRVPIEDRDGVTIYSFGNPKHVEDVINSCKDEEWERKWLHNFFKTKYLVK